MRRLTGYEPFCCLAFGLAVEYLLSPTQQGGGGHRAICPLEKAIEIILLAQLMVPAFFFLQ
jgi:hypothetical protein